MLERYENDCDALDASVFNGELVTVQENRVEFKRYLIRWMREVNKYEKPDPDPWQPHAIPPSMRPSKMQLLNLNRWIQAHEMMDEPEAHTARWLMNRVVELEYEIESHKAERLLLQQEVRSLRHLDPGEQL